MKFGRKIRLPANFTKWSSENEGGERLNITFFPSEETQDALPDFDDGIKFGWHII